MTDRKLLDTLVEQVRQVLAEIEQAGKDGYDPLKAALLHAKARRYIVGLADLHARLATEDSRAQT